MFRYIKIILTPFILMILGIAVFAYANTAPLYHVWYSANDGGPNWRILSESRQLAIDIGRPGSLDSGHAYSATVLKESRGYTMWYGGYDGENWRILRATSPDAKEWIKEGACLNLGQAGAFDSAHVVYPYVIKAGDTYKMWYTANDGTKHWRIGYAASVDGIIFKERVLALNVGPAGSLDSEDVQSPVVLKQGSVYIMWYAGFGGYPPAWRILRATSLDGISWQKQGLALDRGTAGDNDSANLLPGTVIYNNKEGKFTMWYWAQGSNWRILQAVSKNGIDWEKKGVVMDLGPVRSLDSRALVVPAVVAEERAG